MKKIYFLIIPLFLLLYSCNKKQVKTNDESAKDNMQQTQVIEDVSTSTLISPEASGVETDIRKDEFVKQEGIKSVHFDFDKYALSEEARNILNENAKIIKEKKWTIRIDGHCDSRGTIEYNLSLGQKRANVVKDYYIKLGINPNSIGTISYGKEKPSCMEETEECWALNRRADTMVNIQ